MTSKSLKYTVYQHRMITVITYRKPRECNFPNNNTSIYIIPANKTSRNPPPACENYFITPAGIYHLQESRSPQHICTRPIRSRCEKTKIPQMRYKYLLVSAARHARVSILSSWSFDTDLTGFGCIREERRARKVGIIVQFESTRAKECIAHGTR